MSEEINGCEKLLMPVFGCRFNPACRHRDPTPRHWCSFKTPTGKCASYEAQEEAEEQPKEAAAVIEKNLYCERAEDDLLCALSGYRNVLTIANDMLAHANKQIGLVLEEMRGRATKKGGET